MNRLRNALLLLAAILVPLYSLAATPDRQENGHSAAPVTGTYSVTYDIDLVSTLPAGTTIVCKTQIAPVLQGAEGQSGMVVPVESAASVATISGSTATCSVEIPFAWTLSASQANVVLNYEIQAVNATGTLPLVVRNSVLQRTSEAQPATTSSLAFAVIL
jgi:hypothetical protein